MENKINKPGFHHYSIAVSDLKKSIYFYKEIIGLELIERPNFDFEGAWFKINEDGVSLHLIQDTNFNLTINQLSHSRGLHFAFGYPDFWKMIQFLEEKYVIFVKSPKQRPDQIWQAFIKDPDGYFVEITEKIEK